MSVNHSANLPAVRLWKKLPCIQIMIQSVKQPGISSGSPGYHQTVTSCFLKHPFSILRCKNITVSNNWNPHSLLHLTDNLPVRLSRIELFSCSSVDCHSGHTAGFCDFCNFYCIHRGIIKAFPELDCNRLVYFFYKSCKYFFCKLRTAHQSRTLSVVNHLWNRAAHIKINDIKGAVFDQVRHITDNFRIRTKKLYRNRTFSRSYFQKLSGIAVFIKNRLGTYHFCAEQTTALFLTENSKRKIRHSSHRRQNQVIVQLYISYSKPAFSCPS